MENIKIENETTNTVITEDKTIESNNSNKKRKIRSVVIVSIVSIICVMLVIFICYNKSTTLTGDDKIAYELIINASHNFKNPSSVKLVSGTVTDDGSAGSFVLSSTNGFGARTTGYYAITSSGYVLDLDDEDDIMFKMLDISDSSMYLLRNSCEHKDILNMKKINKALEDYWG